jgi:hypothetical protein
VARPADKRHTGPDVGSAHSQVPRPDACAEFGPRDASRPVGLACAPFTPGPEETGLLWRLLG